MNAVTVDTISLRGAGIVTIAQPTRGHRFTLDSILLADFCGIKPRDRVLEPGAGPGVISLLLAKRYPLITVTAIEVQREAADLCRWNAHVNGLEHRVAVLAEDLRFLNKSPVSRPFDVLVANPPYQRTGTGQISPSPSRRISRHEDRSGLGPWLDLSRHLKNRGRLFLVHSANRVVELLASLRKRNLEPKRVRFVHPLAGRPASVVLIEALKDGSDGLEVMPPLFVHDPDGGNSPEMKEIYGLP